MAKTARMRCESCGYTGNWSPLVLRRYRDRGMEPQCPECPDTLTPEIKSSGKTDGQKRSRKQERKSARRLGGNVQPGSGAGRAKGDVRRPWHSRVECKCTTAQSFALRLASLEKIEKEAIPPEKPIFEIEFQGVSPSKRYAVIPGWLLDHFMSLEDE